MGAEGEQVFVAGDEEIRAGALSALEEFVVAGIAAEVEGVGDWNADGVLQNIPEQVFDAGVRPAARESKCKCDLLFDF